MNKVSSNGKPVVRYAYLSSSLGNLLAAFTGKGLCALRLCETDQIANILNDLRQQHPQAEIVEDAPTLQPRLAEVKDVIEGHVPATAIALDLVGTPFQKKVWQTLAKVPWGKTLSYSELARKAGNPLAIRAVASACARNPIAFVVPCHRILRKGGGLGGYYWGLEMKQSLLEREKTS
jgi:AraC family transcriptional regulator of adaptative response/methylated-DNA-[protein]-cysteine methyltransferase